MVVVFTTLVTVTYLVDLVAIHPKKNDRYRYPNPYRFGSYGFIQQQPIHRTHGNGCI
jgi:hypothetical protein